MRASIGERVQNHLYAFVSQDGVPPMANEAELGSKTLHASLDPLRMASCLEEKMKVDNVVV
jgi:hypothetical protein